MKKINRKKLCIVSVLSLLLTLMQITGWQLSMKYGTSVHTSSFLNGIGMLSPLQCVFVGLVEFLLWNLILYKLFGGESLVNYDNAPACSFKKWLLVAGLLFLCWIPFLLGCFPGFYNYDIGWQMQPTMNGAAMSTHHPLLHTFLAGEIISLGYTITGGHLTAGVLSHSFCQMAVCAGFFSYFVWYIKRLTGKKWVAIAAFCYYAFFPVIPMFSMSTTKDVICSILLQMCAIFLCDISFARENILSSRKHAALFVLLITLFCLFRKNAVYAVIALLLCVIIALRQKGKKLFLLLVCGLLMYFLANSLLFIALNAYNSSMVEAFSVPLQQVARLYNEQGEDAFTEEELTLLDAAIDRNILITYNPFLSDYIKNYVHFDTIRENSSDYLKLWLQKGLAYPDTYINAFLDNTYQAWYPGTSIDTDPTGDEQTDYFDSKGWPQITIRPLIPGIYELCTEISHGFSYQKIPVIRLLFSVGFMFWIMLFTLFNNIWKRRTGVVLAYFLILLFCLTTFLGPVSLVRYYLVLFYGFPVSLAIALRR